MTVTETVYLHGKPLGQIILDDGVGLATFKPNFDALLPLATRQWSCPVQCRIDVLAYAEKALEVADV